MSCDDNRVTKRDNTMEEESDNAKASTAPKKVAIFFIKCKVKNFIFLLDRMDCLWLVREIQDQFYKELFLLGQPSLMKVVSSNPCIFVQQTNMSGKYFPSEFQRALERWKAGKNID